MSNAICSVVSYALNSTWQIPLIAGAGWVASRAVRRRGPQPQHMVWIATWMLCIITPSLPIFRAIAYSTGSSGRNAGISGISITGHGGGAVEAFQTGSLALPEWLIWMAFGLYACTVVYFAARLIWLLADARAIVRTSVPVNWNAENSALWQRVRSRFDGNATILTSSSVRGVVTIGARKPAIILPSGFAERSTKDEILSALAHEMAHVTRRDYSKNMLYEIGSILTAFHPITWMIKAQIVQTREMICDALVVDKLVESRIYRQSLLRLAERFLADQSTNLTAVGMFDGNLLKERIMMMKMKKSFPGKFTRISLAASVALLMLTAAIVGTAFARTISAQSADRNAPWGTVYHVGHGVTAPALIFAVDPDYPQAMKATAPKISICVVAAIVDQKGVPQDVHIVRSAGKAFDASALRAVEQYRFKPAQHLGKPVAVAVDISVNFRKY